MKLTEYFIDENAARAAKHANSFSDYVDGSATAEYKLYLERFSSVVEKLVARLRTPPTSEQLESIEYWGNRYSKKLAEAINRSNSIRSRCPSVLIAGFSNFPVRKKEKQNAALDKLMQESGDLFTPESCYYFEKIRTALTNTTIYSDDPYALDKLCKKLEEEEEAHAEMVARNAYYRKHRTMKGYEGLSDAEASRMDRVIENALSWEKQPAPAWKVTNSSAKIRQIKQRIAEIEKIKETAATGAAAESKYPSVPGVSVTENSELIRIQLAFEDKPNEQTRSLLKANGFKWAPSQGVWQRQLNSNGIYATQHVLKVINLNKKEVYYENVL